MFVYTCHAWQVQIHKIRFVLTIYLINCNFYFISVSKTTREKGKHILLPGDSHKEVNLPDTKIYQTQLHVSKYLNMVFGLHSYPKLAVCLHILTMTPFSCHLWIAQLQVVRLCK